MKIIKPDLEKRSFPEDFGQENGNYQNKCIMCEKIFYGNKHRIVCKLCEDWTSDKLKNKDREV